VPSGQGGEQLPCFGDSGAYERRRRWCADVLADVQAQQAEGTGRFSGEGTVRPGENGADLGGRLVGAQRVETIALKGQLID
jgi:hypothetical protein